MADNTEDQLDQEARAEVTQLAELQNRVIALHNELERVKAALAPFYCDNSAAYMAVRAAEHLADCSGAPNE